MSVPEAVPENNEHGSSLNEEKTIMLVNQSPLKAYQEIFNPYRADNSVRSVKKSHRVILPQSNEKLYVLSRGQVLVLCGDEPVDLLFPGDPINPEICITAGSLSTVRACCLSHLDAWPTVRLNGRREEWSKKNIAVMIQRRAKIAQYSKGLRSSAHDKVAFFIMQVLLRTGQLSRQRFDRLTVTRTVIGDLMGVSREMVGRVVQEFQDVGLLERPGEAPHVHIVPTEEFIKRYEHMLYL